jgi:DNA polymerase III subunit epsilon
VPPAAPVLDGWLEEPVEGEDPGGVRAVVDRHGADVAFHPGAGSVTLAVLLPVASGDVAAPVPLSVDSRPEYYDFDLFDAGSNGDRRSQSLDDLAFTVLDTETTGLDPTGGDRIVSIGAVRVVNGRVLRHETFERLVQPRRSVPTTATAIHGITDEMLRDQPTLAETLPELARFCEDTVLVGHDIGFDLQFLHPAETSLGVALPGTVLDTLLLEVALHPAHDDHTLEGIAARLGISIVGRHTALGDALVTADVFVAQQGLLRERGITTLAQALSVSRTSYHARREERLYQG